MKTIRKRTCVASGCPRKCGRDLWSVWVKYQERGDRYIRECLTGDGTLRRGDKCFMRTIQIVGNEVYVAERR